MHVIIFERQKLYHSQQQTSDNEASYTFAKNRQISVQPDQDARQKIVFSNYLGLADWILNQNRIVKFPLFL